MATPPPVASCVLCRQTKEAALQGNWAAVEQLLESQQLTDHQKAGIIVEVSRHTTVQQFSQHIYPVCSSVQLDSAMTLLSSAGFWDNVINLSLCVGHRHPEWRLGDLSVENHLLCIVAKGRWRELRAVLQEGSALSVSTKQWALLQACQRATQREIIEIVLPSCADEDMLCVLIKLVSRGSWWAAGSLLSQRRGISETRRAWAIEQASQEATTWELSDFILPQSTKPQLASVAKRLLARRLWWALDIQLKRDVKVFDECLFPAFGNAEAELYMNHLVSVGHSESIRKFTEMMGSRKYQRVFGGTSIPGKLTQLAAEGQWGTLAQLALETRSPSVLAWVMEEMSMRAGKNEIFAIVVHLCPISQIPSVVNNIVKRGFVKNAARLLCRLVGETVEKWAEGGAHNEEVLLNLVRNYSFDLKDVCDMRIEIHEEATTYGSLKLFSNLVWKELSVLDLIAAASASQLLCGVLFQSAMSIVMASLSGQPDTSVMPQSIDDEVQLAMHKILKEMRTSLWNLSQNIQHLCIEFNPERRNDDPSNPEFALSFLHAVMKHCCHRGQWSPDTNFIVTILATVPVVPDVQRGALKVMLKEKKWDIISLADLSHVGEQVRRMLFSSAVKQKKWSIIKQWSDYTIYDDQRSWALKRARKEKRWDVILHLADQGFTEDEMTCVHYFVAQNANWNVVHDMYKRETDVKEVKQLLTRDMRPMVKVGRKRKQELKERVGWLAQIESRLEFMMSLLQTLQAALEKNDWQVVVYTIRQRPTAENFSMALQAAVASKVWRVVELLFRLRIQTSDEHAFFQDMIQAQQWAVCSVMIDQGLNVELYESVIPQLMELNQWTLVAKLMNYNVDDAVRQQVMHCALQKREGTVVSQCIAGMKQRLSLQEREDLFHRAVTRDVFQAVKPLVAEKDELGVRHRNIALLQAISHEQWDIVEHCLQHHADVNMVDDTGDSVLHRVAQENDWEMVMTLTKRGGDPSLLDSSGMSVLHMAIRNKKWKYVKLLILHHNNIQQSATHKEENRTPLEMLIGAGQRDIIASALRYNTRQWRGVNSRGETTLHTICLSFRPSAIATLLARGVNPLSVTHRGHSALSYAVLSRSCPQEMVAECISHGFTTRQPHITHSMRQTRQLFLSPILLALLRGLPLVTQMLYESGSCSFREVFQVLPDLSLLADPDTQSTCPLMEVFRKERHEISKGQRKGGFDESYNSVFRLFYSADRKLIKTSALYLMEVSTKPRSLKSICRLTISRCLSVHGTRGRDISQLPLSSPLKDYVLFSDLICLEDGQDADDGNDEDWEDIDDEGDEDADDGNEEDWEDSDDEGDEDF